MDGYRKLQSPNSKELTESFRSTFLQKIQLNVSGNSRYVFLNDGEMALKYHTEYGDNLVITSKYTMFTFLPKFLFESFRKLANFFFLVVSILQAIPSISNTYGVPTNAPVLFFVIAIDAVFAIMEDIRRHKSDHEANAAKCHVVDLNEPVPLLQDKYWRDLHVGDVIRIENREVIPADVLILAVSEPPGEKAGGICYVETKSLDGETNLKLRQAMESTLDHIQQPADLGQLNGFVECELPNPHIDKFAGSFHVRMHYDPTIQTHPITSKNVLLRGCILRNTDWVYGMVLNTGYDTKIMQSATPPPVKWSSIMQKLNGMIIILCIALFFICAIAATVNVIWRGTDNADSWYLDLENKNGFEQWIVMLFYYFLLLYQVVPISLYVSMTTVKFLQAMFISWDMEMYHSDTDTPAVVRTMALNEELGQISYVFTDKTGTLTCNVMDFRKCTIFGKTYGTGLTEIGRAAMMRKGETPQPEPKMDPRMPKTPFVNFVDPSLFDDLRGESGQEQQVKIQQFFTHLALCHTVIPEKLQDGEIRLSASSPDEQALVAGASYFGFCFRTRSVGEVVITIDGAEQRYDMLNVLEFNSTRKRMSVILKDPNGQYICYTKGADSVIFERLSPETNIRDVTQQHMERFADDGLRTLAIAIRHLNAEEYKIWNEKYTMACSNLEEIEKRKEGQQNLIDECMEEMECNLELIGATAIEDKLQSGVPSSLDSISKAGIKVWMLTGDKQETAINIGYACSLLNNDVHQEIINCSIYPNEKVMCERFMELTALYSSSTQQEELALIIDGEALQHALEPTCAPHLLSFATMCKSVICCRVSPAQKAQMVNLVKENMLHARTLAIGDGANDVAMITAAHIGIGISGQEGLQAVNSSDYAIAQFRFLERLLLVHGRWNYLRMSKLVVYMFYKNSALVLAQYWYGYLSGASGAKLYWEIGVQVYNIFFTGLPIVVLGVLDQDLSANICLKHPTLYYPGPNYQCFNSYVFLRWMAAAIYESIVIFLFTVYAYNDMDSAVGSSSRVEYGMVAFTLTVLIVNLKVCLIVTTWSWITWFTWWLSVLSWFFVAYIGTSVEYFCSFNIGFDECGSFEPTFTSVSYWFVLIIGCVVALGRHFSWNQFQRMNRPELYQILQEYYSMIKPDTQLESGESIERTVDQYTNQLSDMRSTERRLTRQRSQLDQRYLSFMKQLDETSPRRRTSTLTPGDHRTTGYAFSCDEETTMAESIIAANQSGKLGAISQANRRTSVSKQSKI